MTTPQETIYDTPKNFEAQTIALVINSITVDPSLLPFKLSDGAALDKATGEEAKRFKDLLQSLTGNSMLAKLMHFENEVLCESAGVGIRYTYNSLSEKDWRYYVVRSDDAGTKNIDLNLISGITAANLDFGTITAQKESHSYRPSFLLNYLHYNPVFRHQILTKEHLSEIAELYALKISVAGPTLSEPGPFPEIGRALEMLANLGTLARGSPFNVLGLFAIVEMLVTHNPKLEDRGDSITHQMKGKIPLLSRRFDSPLPYQGHFGAASTDKVWASLYSYRSTVAHGGKLAWDEGAMKLLRDQENADNFLQIVVRSLLRHALREPHLYRDIKDC